MSDALPFRHPSTSVRVLALRPDRQLERPDQVATEEPMEIRVAGPGQRPAPIAVTMRTPGHDFDLAAGFLFTEGIIAAREDVAALKYCDLPERVEQRFNTVTVELTRPLPPERAGRTLAVNASCGVCAKTSIDQISLACAVLPAGEAVPRSQILGLPERLRSQQKLFDRTGGLHGAAVGHGSEQLCVREDVGRHNAVDKLVGHALLAGELPLTDRTLVVSGRVSFEIVQKAAVAGLAIIVAVSAPSSLAVSAADRLGVTIVGFVRGGRGNVYCHPERIDLDR